MSKWQSLGSKIKVKSNFVVLARNIKTGELVRLPMTSRAEFNSFNWYKGSAHTGSGYVPIEINPKFNPKTDRKRYI